MSLEEEHDDTLSRFRDSLEILKKKTRQKLMGMSEQDRFRVLREDFSLKGIEAMCEWALPEEDYEICASVEKVKANNISSCKLRFSFKGEFNNKVLIVKFIGEDSGVYYHADYILHDSDTGYIVMLHKNEDGIWTSEWTSSNTDLFLPIGQAIDIWEGKMAKPEY